MNVSPIDPHTIGAVSLMAGQPPVFAYTFMIPHIHAAIGLTVSALALSQGLTRLMIHFGPKLGLMDQPDERRVHVSPIPRAGGIAIWLSFMFCAWVGKYLVPGLFDGQLSQQLAAFTLSTGILMTVGVIDDRQGIRPLVKLGGQIIASVAFYLLIPKTGSVIRKRIFFR